MLKKQVFNMFSLIMLVSLLAACGVIRNNQPNDEQDGKEVEEGLTIVLGDISDDPAEVIEGTQPLADYLAEGLADYGYTQGHVKIASSAEEMSDFLLNGEVDIYFDSVYPATLISDATGAQPFLRRWRFDVEEYYSVIFTSTDSGIETLDDLKGEKIAFDNPFSTSGYFLPAVYMTELDFQLVGEAGVSNDTDVTYMFTYDDENTLQWVLDGRVAAGATDDYHFFIAFPEGIRDNLILLAQTDSVPRQVAVARPEIDPDLLAAIIEILIAAHEDEAGIAALDAFQTSKFDQFPEGIDLALDRMREMMQIVEGIDAP